MAVFGTGEETVRIAWRDRWGGPEVMELREVATPVPTGDQVLVRVHATSVNRADLDWMGKIVVIISS
jgi:D-arabinose 1-dehydrogenase-like Zn-dependent alcohol dehydrogenase